MCLFSQFFAKNVITATKLEHFETDPMFAMTIQSNLCIFRYDFFFQLSPMYCRALCQDFTAKKLHACLKNIKNVCKALHKIKTIITVLRTPPHWPGVINFGNLNFRTFISRIFLGLFEFYVFLVFILTLSQFCCCCCARRGSWMLIVKRFSDMSEVLYIEAEGLYYDL